jgi:hypothetical protein
MAALIFAWVFGAGSASDGCTTIQLYKTSSSDLKLVLPAELESDAGAKVVERYLEALDAAKGRMFPLAVASLILGSVMWALAAGAMAGRRSARSALLQVLLARALLLVIAFLITPDVRAAMVRKEVEKLELGPEPKSPAERDAQKWVKGHVGLFPPLYLGMQLSGYALVFFALTRRRSREFFEAASAAQSET